MVTSDFPVFLNPDPELARFGVGMPLDRALVALFHAKLRQRHQPLGFRVSFSWGR